MDTIFGGGKRGTDDNNAQFTNSSSHINLFADLEAEYRKNFGVGNRDYELEKRKEQEEYEKKVGILQYLGQGSSELTKVRFLSFKSTEFLYRKVLTSISQFFPSHYIVEFHSWCIWDFQEKPWYEKVPTKKETEFRKSDDRSPIVKVFSKCVGSAYEKTRKKEHKRKYKNKESRHKKFRKKSRYHDYSSLEVSSNEEKSSDLDEVLKKEKLEKLRQERLEREAKERRRLTNLLTPSKSNEKEKDRNIAKYNSQFNPALARQNQIR